MMAWNRPQPMNLIAKAKAYDEDVEELSREIFRLRQKLEQEKEKSARTADLKALAEALRVSGFRRW